MFSHKQIISACVLAMLSASANASVRITPKAEKANVASKAAAIEAYYHTPEQVTFTGLNGKGELDADFAFAPVNKWLETTAEYSPSSAVFQWTYPLSVNKDGQVENGTSTLQQFSFRMKEEGTFAAPVLDVKASNIVKSYVMAKDGIMYGKYGTWENFAVNYQPAYTTAIDQANDFLSTNDATANAYLNIAMAGSLFSDIALYGFGESFYYSDNFYLQAIDAFVYSQQPLSCDDIAVKVLRREKTSVSYDTEVAKLTTDEVTEIATNIYHVVFKCAEPKYITTAMQVILLPAEGTMTKFSPMIPLQKEYHASNMGTASLYATFSIVGNKVKTPQCLDFFGTEVTGDDNNTLGFINNWAIGVKGSYTEPAAVDVIAVDENETHSDIVYNLNGVIVGGKDNLKHLPAGLYICNGKKFIVR